MQSFVSSDRIRIRSFISICLLTAGIQNCPAGSAPVPAVALPAPATAMSRRAARPSSPQAPTSAAGPSSLPAPAAASFLCCLRRPRPRPGEQHVRPRRRHRPRPPAQAVASARWLCASSSQRPSQQVAPAAVTSRVLVGVACSSALLLWTSSSQRQSPAGGARRHFRRRIRTAGEAAKSMSNNAQCCEPATRDLNRYLCSAKMQER